MRKGFYFGNYFVKHQREEVSFSGNAQAHCDRHNGNMAIKIHHKNRRPAHVYLREWLDHRKLTAEQLAGRLETSKSVVSKLMNGHQRYNQDWLEAIAYALDCDVPELYRLPTTPTANELLSAMSPEMRSAAIIVLENLAKKRTGTDG